MIALAFGTYPTQKTCKTYCGKRVKMARIDNDKPDCPDCRRLVVDFARRNREGLLAIQPDTMLTREERRTWERAINSCEDTIRRYS